MRHVLFAALLSAAGASCGDGGALAPPPDLVYISPRFVEAFNEDYCCPQIGDNGGNANDWELDGLIDGGWPNGMGAAVGTTVVLRVHSPLYQSLELSFIVPDTVTRGVDSLRRYYPIVRLSRLVPALRRAQWTADFTGPTVQIEIYAPHGIGGVRITSVSVYMQACLNSDAFCETRITSSADRPSWQPDASATGEWGWADLSAGWPHLDGRWSGWPTTLPPLGYGGPDASRAWQAVLRVSIEDDLGHQGHGACDGGFIPSSGQELACGVLFYH
jgi:hypothetical protein